MESSKIYRVWIGIGISAFMLSLSIPLVHYRLRTFTGDESTYYAMAQSLAHDGDLVYELKDLHRVFAEYPEGPQGIFLKKTKNGRLFYAKSFIYPLFTAPWVHFFGVRGFLITNVMLLWLAWGAAITWGLKLGWPPWPTFFFSAFFLGATVLPVYLIWYTPEVLNFSLVLIALVLWFLPENDSGIFRHPWVRDAVASLMAAMACYSKPPNIILFFVVGIYFLIQRKWKRLGVTVLASSLCLFSLVGYAILTTGEWNFQGGERKTFYGYFPLESANATFEALGVYHSTSINYAQEYYLDMQTLGLDIFYYFFGRYSGFAWYFTPALLGLGQALLRRQPRQLLALLGFFGGMFLLIVVQPNNYLGGGGTLGNRYFTSMYPWAWLMFMTIPRLARCVASGLVAALFAGSIFTAPFMAARFPWMYAQTPWHSLLPLEYTLLENIPSNTLPSAFHVPFPDVENPDYFLYFLGDGFYPKESKGFWVRGKRTVPIILKRAAPYRKLVLTITNGPQPSHKITVRVGKGTRKFSLKPRETVELTFLNPRGFHIRQAWMLPITIKATQGFIPAAIERGNRDRRYLGVYVAITGG